MIVQHFFDKSTSSLTYVVHKEGHNQAIVIDPVWDIDIASGQLSQHSVEKEIGYLQGHQLDPVMNIETHVHADHLSGSQLIKLVYPAMKVAISARIRDVQSFFAEVFHIENDVPADGRPFDYLFADYAVTEVAGFEVKAIPTPGHTPACTAYLIGDALFVGDALFLPDYGTGRCDFPGGSAKQLYHSITENLYVLPDETRVFVGHDYQPSGRELQFETTIGEQKRSNIQLGCNQSQEQFVSFRESRDATLSAPKLLLPSLQVNIRAGHLPAPESNGVTYLKLPLRQ